MSTDPMVIGYKNILDHLYDKYYGNFSGYSDVTSSHWRTIGSQRVLKKNNGYCVEGAGFGFYRRRNLLDKIKSLPERILLLYLLRKYSCPKYLVDAGKKMVYKSGHMLNFDSVKQILSLWAILKTLNKGDTLTEAGIDTVCVIGDGYGFFSGLLKLVNPNIRVISVNLGRTLFFDVLFSQRCLPEIHSILLKTEEGKNSHLLNFQLIFIEAENYSFLENMPIDLFINIASMQEMNPEVIDRYFEYIRTSPKSPCYIYCCNRSRKVLPDGTVTEFMKYPWRDSENLLDELCPWFQKYPSSSPPFWRPFDGPIQHRLARIK